MYYLLFTTTQCPKCPSFKEFVERNVHFPGKIIDERDDKFHQLAREFSISSVPNILVFEDESLESAVCRTGELSELYSFLNNSPK